MNQDTDNFKESRYGGARFSKTETGARLYETSKNSKQAPKYGRGDLRIPPAPPMPMNLQPTNSPIDTQPPPGQQPYPHPNAPDQQPQLPPYSAGTFPYFQRNPQVYQNSIARIPSASRSHRPQRLRVPAVLTTPSGHLGGLSQNVAEHGQAPEYYPSPPPEFRGDGIMGNQMMPIVHQPGMNYGTTSRPRLTPGMVMSSYDNGWASPPQTPVNCPPGLEYLSEIDQLLIHQQIELLELVTGFETKNKYMIRNTLGQSVLFAAEESGCCNRQCLGESRPFDLNFYDHYGNIVMHMYRPLACSSCCCPCCLQSIVVSAPPGNVIGSIHQNWNMFFPRFSVKDVLGNTLLKIRGPFWTMSCCCKDVDFQIMTANGKIEIGKLTKQWSGFLQEAYTDADNFSVSFPMDMDITAKALLLASVFLIDFMYYETNN